MSTYRTTQVAKSIGIHPNTVRLYEELGLISKPMRRDNGYRIFTDFHIEQLKLARTDFQVEVLQGGLRKLESDIVSVCDKLITSLKSAEANAIKMKHQIELLKLKFS